MQEIRDNVTEVEAGMIGGQIGSLKADKIQLTRPALREN